MLLVIGSPCLPLCQVRDATTFGASDIVQVCDPVLLARGAPGGAEGVRWETVGGVCEKEKMIMSRGRSAKPHIPAREQLREAVDMRNGATFAGTRVSLEDVINVMRNDKIKYWPAGHYKKNSRSANVQRRRCPCTERRASCYLSHRWPACIFATRGRSAGPRCTAFRCSKDGRKGGVTKEGTCTF